MKSAYRVPSLSSNYMMNQVGQELSGFSASSLIKEHNLDWHIEQVQIEHHPRLMK
jgi:hypothetical protein